MTIRTATTTDILPIHELGKSVAEFNVNDETVTFWPKELLENAVRSDDVVILVAEEEIIVGFIIANYNHSLKKAIIENVFVTPKMRGKGVGDKLLEQMLAALTEKGCEYIATLIPPNAQGAIELYKRAGFSQGETFLWLDRTLSENYRKNKSND